MSRDDPNATWRVSNGHNKQSRSVTSILAEDAGSHSEAESSQQGWSDAGWNTSTNPRPSLSSSEENISGRSQSRTHSQSHSQSQSRVHSQTHSPILNARSSPVLNARSSPVLNARSDPSIIYGIHPSIQHRRHTLTRPTIHTAGSNVALDALRSVPGSSQHPYSTDGLPVLTMNMNNSPSTLGEPGPSHAGTSAYSSLSHARSRRNQLEVDSEEEDPYPPGSASSASSKGKAKKRGRGGSFTLPFHRRRRLSGSLPWPLRWWPVRGGSAVGGHSAASLGPQKPLARLRSPLVALLLLGGLLYGLLLWKRKHDVQLEVSVFSRRWIREEVDTITPLRGCFSNSLLSSHYNMSQHLAPKRHSLSPGISLKRGMSCYDFSSTIQPIPDVPLEDVTYHTYWRSDLIPFGERQTATFLSFLATQPLTHSKLILWTNGAEALSVNPHVKPFLDRWGEYIQVRQVDMKQLTKGTQLQGVIGSSAGEVFDQRGWVDGDAVRLLVLWHHGGIWMDMDQILTRDLHPLTESEWVTQWDCYDKPYFVLNGALMHFRQHSPYLCEAFHIMSSSPFPKPNTFTWGSHLYSKLHRALLAAHVKPFEVLPWCFADPRNCRIDNRFPDPFLPDPDHFAGKKWDDENGKEDLETRVGQVWTVHLHNQWSKRFPTNGWVERLLDGYKGQLDVLQRYAEANGLMSGGKVRLEDEEL